jgi:hypothetical protein
MLARFVEEQIHNVGGEYFDSDMPQGLFLDKALILDGIWDDVYGAYLDHVKDVIEDNSDYGDDF